MAITGMELEVLGLPDNFFFKDTSPCKHICDFSRSLNGAHANRLAQKLKPS